MTDARDAEIERLTANWAEFVVVADQAHAQIDRIRAGFRAGDAAAAARAAWDATPYEQSAEGRVAESRPALSVRVTDDMVERAASVLWERDSTCAGVPVPVGAEWEQTEGYLEDARAALEAALGGDDA